MQEREKIAKHSLLFLAGTVISRLSGLLRDMAMALSFGTSAELAAFMVAFRFSNLLRRLLSESALSSCFIPQFERLRQDDETEGRLFFCDFALTLLVILLIVVATSLGVLRLGTEIFSAHKGILHLTALMMPGLIFISLFGLTSALLQCQKRFFLASVAPIGFNAIWALGALFAAGWSAPFERLALFVVIAYGMQWGLTLPPVLRWLWPAMKGKWSKCRPFSAPVRALLPPFLLGILGLGASQINSFIDVLFARFANLEGPAFLWYAIRLQQLPLALFGIAIASALLPPLASTIKKGEIAKGDGLLRYCLSRAFALLLPATLGLILVGRAVIGHLFGYGAFDAASIEQTKLCLDGYVWGLVPTGWTLILAPLFYARGDYGTPMKGTVIALCLNTGLNAFLILACGFGAESVAYATSFSAFVNAFYLMKRWGGAFEWRALVKISLCACAAFIASQKGHFILQMALFCGVYWLGAYALKAKEILDLLSPMMSKRLRRAEDTREENPGVDL